MSTIAGEGLSLIKAGDYPESKYPLIDGMFQAHAALEAKVRDSVTFTLDTHLAFMLSGTVRRMTAESSFTASHLMAGDKPVTVYISVPPADADRVRPLTRLLLQALLYPNMRELEHAQDGRKKRHDLLLVIDEMPQLFDVLRGDMSLVGPRPSLEIELEANADVGGRRHRVPAGLTGPSQVGGRSNLKSSESLRIDVAYAENWSVRGDLGILARTVQAVLARRGAY